MSARTEKKSCFKVPRGSSDQKVLKAENQYYRPMHRRAVRAGTWRFHLEPQQNQVSHIGKKAINPYPTRTYHATIGGWAPQKYTCIRQEDAPAPPLIRRTSGNMKITNILLNVSR